MLDEECILPRGIEKSLLQKMNTTFKYHQHYFVPKRSEGDLFGVRHFAGDVAYDVTGFLDKNRDTLVLIQRQ